MPGGQTAQRVERTGHRLLVGDPQAVPLSLVISPQQSVMSVLRQVASGCTQNGATPTTVRAVQSALGPSPRYSMHTVGAAPCGYVPDSCAPIAPATDTSVAEQVERLRSMPGELLTDELRDVYGEHVPPVWRPALDNPRRWLHSWAAASDAAWSVTAHMWQSSSRPLDREIRRVATAALRGSTDVLLNTLHPRLRYRDGEICFGAIDGPTLTLSGRRLILVPMIGTGDSIMVSFDQPEIAYIAYPLPRASLARDSAQEDPLGLTLGPVRAATLRTLSRPHTVGQLAVALGIAPATTTYHCDQLRKAGLLDRTRQGRHVLVSRTLRGNELVELLSA